MLGASAGSAHGGAAAPLSPGREAALRSLTMTSPRHSTHTAAASLGARDGPDPDGRVRAGRGSIQEEGEVNTPTASGTAWGASTTDGAGAGPKGSGELWLNLKAVLPADASTPRCTGGRRGLPAAHSSGSGKQSGWVRKAEGGERQAVGAGEGGGQGGKGGGDEAGRDGGEGHKHPQTCKGCGRCGLQQLGRRILRLRAQAQRVACPRHPP